MPAASRPVGPTLANLIRPTHDRQAIRRIEPVSSGEINTLDVKSSGNMAPLASSFVLPSNKTASSSLQTGSTRAINNLFMQDNNVSTREATLERPIQTLTHMQQPVNYQRRAQQNVVQMRASGGSSNRILNKMPKTRQAGENWYLFYLSNENLSAFEILVLVSNILIVSTIILVLLFNWVKTFKKRRRSRQDTSSENQMYPNKQDHCGSDDAVNNNNQCKLEAVTSDRGSEAAGKVPLAGSGDGCKLTSVSSNVIDTSANSTDGVAATSSSQTLVNKATTKHHTQDHETMKVRADRKTTGSDLIGNGGGSEKPLVGEAKNLDGEFQQSGTTSVANKAMAIVQPTENVLSSTSLNNDGLKIDELANKKKDPGGQSGMSARSIGRSVSDLSGKAIGSSGRQLMLSTEETKSTRASSTTTPDRDREHNNKLESVSRLTVDKSDKRSMSPLLRSSSSLESTELPKNLVDSMQRQQAPGPQRNQLDQTPEPSPNLLLGETPAQETASVIPEVLTTTSTTSKSDAQSPGRSSSERPQNPMADRMIEDNEEKAAEERKLNSEHQNSSSDESLNATTIAPPIKKTETSAGMVTANGLDRGKTDLEASVDLHDERRSSGKIRSRPTGESGAGQPEEAKSVTIDDSPGVLVGGSAAGQQQQQHQLVNRRWHAPIKQQEESSGKKEYAFNNVENELEVENRLRNRKYFVYVVHDGHFTASKQCIARIEVPAKKRITLAELRQLISNSPDVSLASLRRNRFRFVTETYRLLNENEDGTVLNQVYPTQGVFLKMNAVEQESQASYRGGGGGGRTSSRASSVGPTQQEEGSGAHYKRSKSSIHVSPRSNRPMASGDASMRRAISGRNMSENASPLSSIGMSR